MASPTATAALEPDRGGIAGHPRGLTTLFFTEMWERFSYYGMRALLILFMVAPAESGGLGMDAKRAAAIYGLYTFSVYFTSIPGGWTADRLLGTDGLPAREMPAVNQPVHGTIGYHVRSCAHDLTDYGWRQYLAFADHHWRR